ncbi:MAG: class I SAM-dependent methyltransferase [Lachnospiraceae bacterium]|nr:class I SAM-dependent methyltransferase [Lachnospiraceae bacterium]
MYSELINRIKPLPKFNLKWYKNTDLYSEGEVEDLIIQLIAANESENYTQAIYNNYAWSTYYHLTHLRKNILNWYPFEKNASILEIGCGLGAITGLLCDRCEKVTAVELSKKRATATLLRCKDKENLEIIVGNLNDIEFEEKFDYITLIGVLEYQGSYTETENPYLDFLKKIKGLLKPNGKLLIAIENQYGLKYWCGAREDHTAIPFEGMNQYFSNDKKVRTFSRSGLEELVKQSGFTNTYFYYPMPDYKLPAVVYSEKTLPVNGNMLNMKSYYTDRSTLVAIEEYLYEDIVKNRVFEFFANSFLVECSDADDIGKVTFATMSSERTVEYRIGTSFTATGRVEKFALTNEGMPHILQILKNEQDIRMRGLKVCESTLVEGKLESDYVNAASAEAEVLDAIRKRNDERVYMLLDGLFEEICKSSEEVPGDKNLIFSFGLDTVENSDKYGKILETGYLDMILRNAFILNDEYVWFDQEWTLENVPAKFIMFRALRELYKAFFEIEKLMPILEVAKHYGLEECWSIFEKVELLFAGTVMDQAHLKESEPIYDGDRAECIVNNIKKILNV